MTRLAAPARPPLEASRGRPFVCPGCARPLLHDGHVEPTEGYARCTACDAVFVVPRGAFVAAFATEQPSPKPDLRVVLTERRARAAGYRTVQRGLVDQRELRMTYAPGQPVNNAAVAGVTAVAAGLTIFAATSGKAPESGGKLALLAVVWIVVSVFFAVRALLKAKPHALVEISDGRIVVDRATTYATIDVEGVHVARRMVPMREAAAVFGKLSERNAETTALFDLVAHASGRSEVLATFATADHAILAEAAVSDALGLDARVGRALRVAVDPLGGAREEDAPARVAGAAERAPEADDDVGETDVDVKRASR